MVGMAAVWLYEAQEKRFDEFAPCACILNPQAARRGSRSSFVQSKQQIVIAVVRKPGMLGCRRTQRHRWHGPLGGGRLYEPRCCAAIP